MPSWSQAHEPGFHGHGTRPPTRQRSPATRPIPTGSPASASDWLEHMAMRDLSPHTVWAHAVNLARFVTWAELRGVTQPG